MISLAVSGRTASAEGEPSKKSDTPVEVVADNLEYSKDQKKITAKGNVAVSYKNLKLEADRAEVYTEGKKASADGHVTIYDGTSSISGEHVEYDLQRRTGSFPDGSGYQHPWYFKGEEIQQVSRDEFRLKNASATTCDYDDPHYDLFAKDVTIYPNDKIVMKNAYIRILGRKVFWIPYMTVPLDERESPVEIRTGYSSTWGYYMLVAKEWSVSKNVKVKGHVDYRSLRGVAGGVDVRYDVPEFGRGKIITYFLKDKRAPNPGGENPFTDRSEESRYRFSIRHRTNFEKDTHLIFNWHELSDEFLLQDFFQREDRAEAKPRSQIILTRTKDDYNTFIEVAKRTNTFNTEVEKLPRLNFNWRNQPLFDTQTLYRHETQYTNFTKKLGRQAISGIKNHPYHDSYENEATMRFDTTHEVQRPFNILDGTVKLTPYANIREAIYSNDITRQHEINKTMLGHGIEARTRYQKTYDTTSDFMNIQIDKLRHIFEPIFRYDAIRLDTAPPEKLFYMDEFDRLQRHDTLTFAIDQRLQTKRNTAKDGLQRVDIVSYNQFVNLELDGGRNGGTSFTDWGHQVTVRPYDWLLLQSRVVFDMNLTDFREGLFDLVIEPESKKFRLILSQGYLRTDPNIASSETSNVIVADITYKLNALWSVGGYIRSQLEDGRLEEWELRWIRDLHDFLLTFGFNQRNSLVRGEDSSNVEAFAEITMKAFPSASLGVGNRSSITRPRIGRYINGSNAEDETLPSAFYGAY